MAVHLTKGQVQGYFNCLQCGREMKATSGQYPICKNCASHPHQSYSWNAKKKRWEYKKLEDKIKKMVGI
jgi:hypothetical protein